MFGDCRTAALRLRDPTGSVPCFNSLLSAHNSVVVLGSSHCSFNGFAALVVLVMPCADCASAAGVDDEVVVVVVSTSRRLAELVNERAAAAYIEGAADCVARPCRRQRVSGSATCWHLDIFVVEQRTIERAACAFVGLARDVEAQVGAWAGGFSKISEPPGAHTRASSRPAAAASLRTGPCAPSILDLFGIDTFTSINRIECRTRDTDHLQPISSSAPVNARCLARASGASMRP